MISGYCWPQSTRAGEHVALMVSSDASTCTIEVVRVGLDDVVVERFDGVAVADQPVPATVGSDGCGWNETLSITVDPAWTSGFYLVRLSTESGEQSEAFFVVKASEPGDTLLVLSTTTWAAYNHWEAPSFYTGGHISSMHRPLPTGFLRKEDPHRYRAALFAAMDRTEAREHFATHSYFSSAAGFANWERLFVQWAEREGLTLDYATSLDLANDPDLLAPYRLYFSIGHDEYWSASMRDQVESWVEDGGVAAFLSGNTAFWQIRLEEDAAAGQAMRVIGYKFDFEQDPVVGTAAETSVATMWSDPLCQRPENEMTGVSFTRGGYANMINSPPGGGYTVHQPEHWLFAGLGVSEGDTIGAESTVVGFECDGCAFELVDGRPVPTGQGGTPKNLEILATAPAKLWETHEIAGGLDDGYVGELNWVADRLGGGDSQANRDRFEAGHAVLGTFTRGNGWVVTAGCTDWAYGLDDPTIAGITRNIVNRALGQDS